MWIDGSRVKVEQRMDWMLERGFNPVEVTLFNVVEEAPGIKSFYLDYDKNRFQYMASQVVHLHLDFENNRNMYHPFSIASSPTEDFLLFTMRMRAESIYKQKLNKLKPGDKLKILGPVGKFILPEDPLKQGVMLGGGIGITPFRSMIKFATDKQLPHKITLIYSSRTPEAIMYRKEWNELAQKNPHLTLVHTITRPEASKEDWKGRIGRIDEALIRDHVEDTDRAVFYVCGTPSLVRGLTGLLRDMKVDTHPIKVDTFHGYN